MNALLIANTMAIYYLMLYLNQSELGYNMSLAFTFLPLLLFYIFSDKNGSQQTSSHREHDHQA
jgi:hypothetical protein